MEWWFTPMRRLCQWSYYVNLLGLKIPVGLLFKASQAPHVLAAIVLVWLPFLLYSHAVLLPKVREATTYGSLVWQLLLAMWVTIPACVVGGVVILKAYSPKMAVGFASLMSLIGCFHFFAVPCVWNTFSGSLLLQVLFFAFEDLPILAWIWCLAWVVRLQRFVEVLQAGKASPIAEPKGPEDTVLIVGNAPTVTEGAALGPVIDSFTHVVRFNQFSISRPDFTGSKVGFHFCNGRNFPKTNTVVGVCPLFNASLTHAAYLFMPHMEEARDIFNVFTNPKVDSWFIDEESILALRKKLGCAVWQIPTSGMVAVDAFLRKRDAIMLHGFNFFQGKKIHYFEESPTQLITSWLERFVTHNPSLEKKWVNKLQKEGRVTFLSQALAEATTGGDVTKAVSGGGGDVAVELMAAAAATDKEKTLAEDDNDGRARARARERRPGLFQTILRDGMPSQFSL